MSKKIIDMLKSVMLPMSGQSVVTLGARRDENIQFVVFVDSDRDKMWEKVKSLEKHGNADSIARVYEFDNGLLTWLKTYESIVKIQEEVMHETDSGRGCV